jgi:hypothetical protein
MPVEYAFVNDVWGKPTRSRDPQNQRQDPACGLLRQRRGQQQHKGYKQSYENIMDTYMDEPTKTFNVDVEKDTQHYDLTQKHPTRSEKCGFDVMGVSEDYGNAFSFDRYFAEDNIFDNAPSMYSKQHGEPSSQVDKRYNSSYTDEEQEERNNKAPMMDWSAEVSQQVPEHEHEPEPEEEEPRRFVYRGVDDEYDDTQKLSNTSSLQKRDYMDLILYVFSGVFLIFFMEQILQLGMYLGR